MVQAAEQTITYAGRGATSRQNIAVEVSRASAGQGIVFEVSQNGKTARIPAQAGNVVNTLRNVTLGSEGLRLCIVEHFRSGCYMPGPDQTQPPGASLMGLRYRQIHRYVGMPPQFQALKLEFKYAERLSA